MLCQNCGKNAATFHYTVSDNGAVSETHLCRSCAEKAGLLHNTEAYFEPFSFAEDFFADSETMLGGLLGGFLGNKVNTPTLRESAVCPGCGMRLAEFAHGGKAGCGKCYTTFKDALAPTIKKLHGNTRHTGKFPSGRKAKPTVEQLRAELTEKMQKAVEKQEYEKAAEYRDKIKALDSKAENR